MNRRNDRHDERQKPGSLEKKGTKKNEFIRSIGWSLARNNNQNKHTTTKDKGIES